MADKKTKLGSPEEARRDGYLLAEAVSRVMHEAYCLQCRGIVEAGRFADSDMWESLQYTLMEIEDRIRRIERDKSN